MWNWHAKRDLPPEILEAEPDLPLQMQGMVSYMASRTKFFDSFFLTATNAGIKQAVILAAGLDARSWRLPWPDGVTVYELDQDRVLDFKLSTLTEHGAQPAANRSRWRWTYGMTGRRRCWRPVLTRRSRASGRPKA